jgi:UDP-N-acetylglucosamine transferase subunit ALG13
MQTATVVITHGGPTTISEARRLGHRPIVVPRASKWGEHVDDHQVRFTARLQEADLIDLAATADALSRAVENRLLTCASPRGTGGQAESARAAHAFGQVVDGVMQSTGRRNGSRRLREALRAGR